MNSDWWKKIDETYRTARELTGDAQSRFLDTACMADLEMRRQVEMLLKEHEDRNTLLNRPTIEFTNGQTVLAKAPDANSRILNDPGTGRQTVAHYRILEKLDSGGMGEVYRARDERLGRYVAVKFLHGHATEDRATMQRFIREAQSASALNHPNIVTIHEIGEAEGDYFIVMEMIEGRNLRAIISQRPSVETLIQLGSQIARALAVAHRAGIVHRDIKPENIMVRDDGCVKVLDFGLARLTPVLGQSAEQSTLTEKGTMFGTLRYMSPEQLRGEVAGFPSDIFALGVVLYEFVTGQHPFPSDSQIGTMQAILSNQAFSPSHLNTAIRPTWRR